MWPPRSLLFVPGDQPHKFVKAASSDADAVIVDLEDAVAPERKAAARAGLADALSQTPFDAKTLLIRINAVTSPFAYDDLLATLRLNPDGVVVPKVETPAQLRTLHSWLEAQGAEPVACLPLVESALGVLNLRDLLLPSAPSDALRPAGVLFGAEDYLASVGGAPTTSRREVAYARGAIVAAAAAAGVPAFDTVFTAYRDLDGLRADAQMARQFGFAGKLVIHPAQVAVVNDVWRVDSAEIDAARALLSAYERHLEQGVGVFSYEGRMVDEAVIRRARQLLLREASQQGRTQSR